MFLYNFFQKYIINVKEHVVSKMDAWWMHHDSTNTCY
jgi:hypothetical protein